MPAGQCRLSPSSGESVIVRVLRANVRTGRVGAFNALLRRQVALMREQPGLVYVRLARRLQADGSEEAILFEEWQDPASLYGWVGPNLVEPRLIPGVRELIEDIHVAHYEVLAADGEPSLDEADPLRRQPDDPGRDQKALAGDGERAGEEAS